MVATPLSATSRYIPVGKRQFYWVSTMANYHTPTRSELDAGKDLTAEIPQDGVSGFTQSSDSVDAGDFASRFTGKVPGLITADDSSINLYMDEDSDDARTVLAQDDEGYVVIFPEGDDEGATEHTMDVYPAKVSSVAKQESGTDASMLTVSFTITKQPAENITVPDGS